MIVEEIESVSIAEMDSENVQRKIHLNQQLNPVYLINYHGISMYQAAASGNLPICVLLWGLASAKHLNLVVSDAAGNNPMHFAALADNAEVSDVRTMNG